MLDKLLPQIFKVEKVFRLGRTVSHFRTAQLGEKFQYQIVKFCYDKNLLPLQKKQSSSVTFLKMNTTSCCCSIFKDDKFLLLNHEWKFEGAIDWNYYGHGQLWNIRLNSLDYLSHHEISKEDGQRLLLSMINEFKKNKTQFDSHCASLRIINAIKFCSRFEIDNNEINSFIFSQAAYVKKNSENHLRNNHLLENGFALLFASQYFNDEKSFKISSKTLGKSIEEQILPDGGHFELCPMYHLWTVNRMLESLQILRASKHNVKELLQLVEDKLTLMLGWIIQMQFSNGTLPAVNDSAEGYGPGVNAILKSACDLGVKGSILMLKESGFRKFKNRNFELLVDVNGLTPKEAPGHSHADTFHFILHVFGDPFIVDTGVSTYEPSKARLYERSTSAHNTVTVEGLNQSELYDVFRAGRRANVKINKQLYKELEASHDGYKHLGITHTRNFVFENEKIIITDIIKGQGKDVNGSAYLHIDKKNRLLQKDKLFISKFITIHFENSSDVEVSDNFYATTFGKRLPCYVIKSNFKNKLVTTISLTK